MLPPFTYYALQPTASFPLDLWGGAKRGVERARALADYENYQLKAAYLNLYANIAAQAFRNAGADEAIFVHHGKGTLHTMFGPLPFREGDYVVIPRCTTFKLEFDPGVQPDLFVIESTGNEDAIGAGRRAERIAVEG